MSLTTAFLSVVNSPFCQSALYLQLQKAEVTPWKGLAREEEAI